MGISLAMFPLILLGIMIAWGFVIGTRNVIIRVSGVVISLVAAIISVIVLKHQGFHIISPILELLLSGSEIGDSVLEILSSAQTLGNAMISIAIAIAAPIVFVTVFVAFAVITWIIGLIVGLVLMLVKPGSGKKKRSAIAIIPCVILQAVITVFVLLTPVAAYGSLAYAIVDNADIVSEFDPTVRQSVGVVNTLSSSPMVGIYRTFGGDAVCKSLTTFRIGDVKGDLISEGGAIGRVAGDVLYLSGQSLAEYGEDEADAVRDLSDNFADSTLIPALLGEVIYSATDAWLEEEEFFGVSCPDLEEKGAEIFDEAFTHLLILFHNDARDRDALCADIETIANAVVILSKNGIFSAMGEDENALIDKLSTSGTVRALVEEFGSNPSFKILIADVTNIGMRAIGTTLNIPENADEVYSDFTGSIAEELTQLNASDVSEEEKCDKLAEVIKTAIDDSGVAVELDDEVLKLYAKTIIEDYGSRGEVTAEDISEFFRVYSEASGSNETQDTKVDSGARLLARIMNDILVAQSNGNADDEEVKRIIETACVDYALAAGKDASVGKELADSLTLSADAITPELVTATSNMRSSEALAESSSVVTMEDLLVDPEEVAKSLDSEEAVKKEAEAIENVFVSVGEVTTVLGNKDESMGAEDLADVAENIGTVLDNLSETGALGKETTGKLMTAVMQSETVRDAANLDMKTATEIADAANDSSNGEVNYKETMTGIASGASVADKLNDENAELTREDIRELLDNMTPQTAKVLNAYMTEKRVAGFGVPESKVALSTEMINNLLTEMGNKDKYSTDYENEIDGIATLFDLLNAATSKDSDSKTVFNHGTEPGRLNTNAYDFTGTVLGSDMVCNALIKSLNKDGVMTEDPFGLNLDKSGADYIAVRDALNKHLKESSDTSDTYRERVDAVCALFGIER